MFSFYQDRYDLHGEGYNGSAGYDGAGDCLTSSLRMKPIQNPSDQVYDTAKADENSGGDRNMILVKRGRQRRLCHRHFCLFPFASPPSTIHARPELLRPVCLYLVGRSTAKLEILGFRIRSYGMGPNWCAKEKRCRFKLSICHSQN